MRDTMEAKGLRKMVGICGLYCGTCPNYLAPRLNDVDRLEAISRETGLPVEKIRCDGCLSDNVFSPCVECKYGFRKCASEKKVTWCFECQEFPCERLRSFRDAHVVDGISHHAHVVEDLSEMRARGVETWAREQEMRDGCPRCGRKVYWFSRECPECRSKLK